MTDTVFVRASSVGALLDCAARWQAIYRQGLRVPGSLAAQLGTAIHAGTAVFDTERLTGAAGSVNAATDAAAEVFDKPREEIALQADDNPRQAQDIAVSLTEKYCTEYAPTVEYAAVELNVNALELTDLGITLTGTTDRVRRREEGLGVSDLKSGKTAVSAQGQAKTAGHAVQLGVYELIAEAGMGIRMDAPAEIVGLQTNVTREKQRIASGDVWRPSETLTGDGVQEGLLPVIAKLAKGEIVIGNPKSFMCSEKFCPVWKTCFFRR
jgi:RecB family exonuclease